MLILALLFLRTNASNLAESTTAIAPILTDSETLIRNSYHAEEARKKSEVENPVEENFETSVSAEIDDFNSEDGEKSRFIKSHEFSHGDLEKANLIEIKKFQESFSEESKEKPLIFNPHAHNFPEFPEEIEDEIFVEDVEQQENFYNENQGDISSDSDSIENRPSKNCSNVKIEIESSLVDHEWLVIFDDYFSSSERLKIMTSSLDHKQFEVIKRDNPAQEFKSDFEVIRTTSNDVIEILSQNDEIKTVRQQRQLTRALKFVPLEEAECQPCPKPFLPSEARVRRSSRKIQQIPSGDYWFGSERFKSRKLHRSVVKPVTDELQADILWEAGYSGQGINVAVFDTGLPPQHPHFKNVKGNQLRNYQLFFPNYMFRIKFF